MVALCLLLAKYQTQEPVETHAAWAAALLFVPLDAATVEALYFWSVSPQFLLRILNSPYTCDSSADLGCRGVIDEKVLSEDASLNIIGGVASVTLASVVGGLKTSE